MPTYGFKVNVEGNAKAKIAEITTALKGLGVDAKVETQHVENAFTRMHNHISEKTKGIRNLVAGGLGLGLLFAGGELMEHSMEFTNRMQEATADLHQTLISMGGGAGYSQEKLLEMADSLDKVTTASKPTIIAAEAMLETFGRVKGDQFKAALQSSADYAAKFFQGDMVAASKSLGIALDDPIHGMMRLHRTGVSFTEQQKEQIKNLQKAGNIIGAQQIILKEIARETGGQAVARGQTDAGKLEIAKKQWDSVYEKIGNIINRIKIGLIPVIGAVVKVLGFVLDMFTSNSIGAEIFRVTVILVAGAITAFAVAMTVYTIATSKAFLATLRLGAAMLAMPLTWIVILIVGVIVAIGVLWDRFKGFREFLGGFWGGFVQGLKGVWDLLVNAGKIIYDIISGNWSDIAPDMAKGLAAFKQDFITGMSDAISKGAKEAGESAFKFGNLLNFGKAPSTAAAGDGSLSGKGGGQGSGIAQSAINTSQLSGASGGLGQAKVINIRIDKMQNIEHLNGGKELAEKGQNAIEVMVRTVNNLAYSQSGSQ